MSHFLRQASLAREQLYEQAEYIHDQGQPEASRRLIQSYLDTCEVLTRWPNVGHAFETTNERLRDIQIIKIPGYRSLIYYRFDDPVVTVLAVMHGSLDRLHVEQELERSE